MTTDGLRQILQDFPYPLVWVEQQAPGQYHSQVLNGSPAHPLPIDRTELHQLAARCLTRQHKQRQWFTQGETDYWVELTPLSATQALGLVIPAPLGTEPGQSLCPYTDQAPVIIWLADKRGQVIYLNHQWTVLTGWPAERALGQGWFDLVHPEDSALLQTAYWNAVHQGVPYQVDFRIRCTDGHYLWLNGMARVRLDRQSQPVGLLGASVPITARKQAEQLTREQGEYSQFLVNLSAEILEASFDLNQVMQCAVTQLQRLLRVSRVLIAPVQPDGTVVFRVEAVSDPEFSLLHTQILDPCFAEEYLELYRRGRVQAVDDVLTTPMQPCHRELLQKYQVQANLVLSVRHQERLWGLLILHECRSPRVWRQAEIDLAQQVANVLGLALHRGELYEQVRQQQALYRQIVEHQDELICRHNREGHLTFVNPALCRYLGQTEAEALQQPLTRLALQTGEQAVQRGDGRWGWVQWQSQAITDSRGEVVEMQWVGRDVTTAHEVQQRLQLMEAVVVCANDGIVITQGTEVIYANPNFLAMTGYTLAELQAVGLGELCGEKTDLTQWEYVQKCRQQRASVRTELVQYRKDGQDFWVELTVLFLNLSSLAQEAWVWVYRDITAQKDMEARLLYDAFHDSLTGLPNRNFLMDRMHRVHQGSIAAGTAYAVLFADIDRFKLVNDSLGHTVGDEILQKVAQRLRQHIRPGDTLARLGGDEFVVLLAPVADVTEAVAVAERLHQQLLEPFVVQGQELVLSSSIGLCLNDHPDYSPADILRNADIAMYQVKLGGRCGVQVFQPGMYDQLMGQLELETALRRALFRQEFVVYYQPVVHLERGEIVGFEALVRWQRPGVGLVSPGVFIPVAEESGLIYSLSEWVLSTACQQLAQWRTLRPELTMAVNLSGRLFRRAGEWVAQVQQTLQKCDLPPQSLVLEVTEGVLMADPQTVGAALSQLRQQGVQVSIDDFGTGYSSLGRLQSLPVDILKIDRSFIQQMTQGGELVQAIVALSATLNKDVVAEGIETAEQLLILQRFTAKHQIYAQGYWFAPPLPAAAAAALLSKTWQVHPQPR